MQCPQRTKAISSVRVLETWVDGSKVGPLKGSTDIYDTTAHRQRYAADLGLLVQDGVRIVRVCIPYHLIDRGGYDWTWTDAYMNCIRALGLTPIVDPVHHASFPPWCIGGFSHPEFQDRYLAFMEAFVDATRGSPTSR